MIFKILEKNKNFNTDIRKKLIKYIELLKIWNKKFNLTSIIEDEEIIKKHFYDSLIFTSSYELNNQTILDIGTGAGFPGMVLKIFYENLTVILLESNNKKVLFLKEVIKELDLKNIFVSNERAEVFSINNKEKFDIVISRAVAQLNILLEIGVQALKVDGTFIALKGKNYQEEVNILNNCEYKIGLKFMNKQIYEDLYLGTRANLFYKKISSTPNGYPRNYNKIKKRPLGE
ncbi:16S rRNA (guanine527-N7)-methyltransferase [Spiroplasma litorale]|uniref:Ribosomal RNA small subunit methyltransferase G n=1 Tax=Spiroplasma litorale TaxID=216942 RepID=A0A0K1W3C9_9MOLU|nr:16S rRNA (guanine(527)-N(7))-methyltransferase RsmG [Spiroplasma litorale]AKX34696.1 16S rRNA (guanine527-N7)-methyltransferase [Spiroplasma litorale]